MKLVFLFIFGLSISIDCFNQMSHQLDNKPPLDFSILGRWHSVANPKISNDGRYILYNYNSGNKIDLFIKECESSWEKCLTNTFASNALFLGNSQFVIIKTNNDSLYLINLFNRSQESIAEVASFKIPEDGSKGLLAYQMKNKNNELVVCDLINGKKNHYNNVIDYQFSKNGHILQIKTQTRNTYALQLIYTLSGKSLIIYNGLKSSNFVFDNPGNQFAFIGDDPNDKSSDAVWYYREGMDSAMVLINNKSDGILEGLHIRKDLLQFNKNGNYLFFYLEAPALIKPKTGYVSVDIWSYTDSKLQSQQLSEVNIPSKYLSVVKINSIVFGQPSNVKVFKIQNDGEEISTSVNNCSSSYILVSARKGSSGEVNWNKSSLISIYLIDIKDGSRKLINSGILNVNSNYSLSPDGNFIISFDEKENCYYSYDIAKGIKRNISKDILLNVESDRPIPYFFPYNMGVWLDDKVIFVYDKYDIWQLDPSGIQKPINVTNGFGRKNGIVLRLLTDGSNVKKSIKKNNFVISGFNEKNKNSGFFAVDLIRRGDPQILTMGPFNFSEIVKSNQSDVYLISRMSSIEPSNYFVTKDFKTFSQISAVPNPNKSYNWFTSEVIEWNTFNGTSSQGILYKPDNFDSTKKYPVIFLYYEQKSNRLNDFIQPDFSDGEINIPYFVSNGYLIFTPDIHYQIGFPGESAYNSVVSAAKYLRRYSWVDSNNMGISGHSFGGFETNYLITRTNIFKAAVSASGMSDCISDYNLTSHGGISRQRFYEISQNRLGVTLWQNTNLFIENSPILKVNEIATPILLMNNNQDRQVPFSQGLEFFTALRRLGKRAWMLQYDHGGHGVSGEDAEDFTKRVNQFFNHYLKGENAPKWMTQGVQAKFKGIDDGFELDSTFKTPGNGINY